MIKAWTNAVAAMAAVATLALAQTGRAEDFIARDRDGRLARRESSFGDQGVWAFSTDTALSIQRETRSNADGAVTTLKIAPASDFFVIDNLSVGGIMGIEYTKAGSGRSTRFTLGPRVGYDFELSDMLSVWPKLGFSFSHGKLKNETPIGDVTYKSNAIALNLFVPVMIHPAPHFFAGFGPFLDTDLNGDSRTTVWGLKLTLGGWI